MGIGSSVSVVHPSRSSRAGFGSQIIGSLYRGLGSQSSPLVGTPAVGSQLTGASTSGSSSDEDRPVWELHLGKKNPKWLRDTLKEA